MASIRQLTNGIEASFRRFVWCDDMLCEEREANGALTKRFFEQGMKLETGLNAGNYYYTRDHLGSIRELTDSSGNVRARYSYDPFGRRTKLAGDLEADFGFTGWFIAAEAGLAMARFRAYDAELGRWLSRDPLPKAELEEGANLYAYVRNNPVNATDPLGLCCEKEFKDLQSSIEASVESCGAAKNRAAEECQIAYAKNDWRAADYICRKAYNNANFVCEGFQLEVAIKTVRLMECLQKGCKQPSCDIKCETNFITGEAHCKAQK
jgi:RHS repeat-associated protein